MRKVPSLRTTKMIDPTPDPTWRGWLPTILVPSIYIVQCTEHILYIVQCTEHILYHESCRPSAARRRQIYRPGVHTYILKFTNTIATLLVTYVSYTRTVLLSLVLFVAIPDTNVSPSCGTHYVRSPVLLRVLVPAGVPPGSCHRPAMRLDRWRSLLNPDTTTGTTCACMVRRVPPSSDLSRF